MRQQIRHLLNRSKMAAGIARSVAWQYRRIRGQELSFRPQVACSYLRLGTEYGAHAICPDEIGTNSVVYSFGIGGDISFDLAVIDRFGVRVHGFDPTSRSIAWIHSQRLPENFEFHPIGIAAFDGELALYPPIDRSHVSYSAVARKGTGAAPVNVSVNRLATIMHNLGHRHIDVLKMDVEGAEYEVLEDVIESRLDVRQILVEFHHQIPGVGVGRTLRAISRLNAAGFLVFAVSRSCHHAHSDKGWTGMKSA